MYCSKCGKEIDENSLYCQYCGYKMVAIDQRKEIDDFQYQKQVVRSLNNIDNNTKDIAYSLKNKYVAGVLALFLGMFGAHNFYVGKTGKAIVQLGITIANFSAGIIFSLIFPTITGTLIFAWIVVIIWTIIEAIIFFAGRGTDKYGKIVSVPSR